MAHDYDLIVLGSGPAGQKAAIQAAKLGRRAVVVEKRDLVGGVCTNTGTIPSKTLREAVLYLTGLSQRTDLWPGVPAEGRDHGRGPVLADEHRDGARDRRDPVTARAQPRHRHDRRGAVRRPAHGDRDVADG
jgi:pyruvate/2-oxoglutarate dehydrogenase complex dihydrolipoamide dehydrogenase (E3) component